MRRVMAAVVIVLASMGAVPAAAQTDPGFEVGVDTFDYRYRERYDGSIVARDRGTFVGLSARYVETLGNGWSLSARVEGATADVDYTADDGTRIRDVPQSIGRFELGLARDIAVGRAVLTPSIGIGGRLLEDRSGGRVASDGSAGYDRDIFYGYVPVGIAIGVPAGGARLTAGIRYAWLANGEVESRLSQADAMLPDLTLDLNGGHLIEAEATVSVPIGRHMIAIGPFLRRWTVDPSDSATVTIPGAVVDFFEPRTRTVETGVRLAFRF